jgi:hypothetical protein
MPGRRASKATAAPTAAEIAANARPRRISVRTRGRRCGAAIARCDGYGAGGVSSGESRRSC